MDRRRAGHEEARPVESELGAHRRADGCVEREPLDLREERHVRLTVELTRACIASDR